MPAFELGREPQALSRYDVLGLRADHLNHFVTHVGLLDADNQFLKAGDDVNAVHMQPPLKQGETIKPHVAGSLPLTNEEIKRIAVWIVKIADEYVNSGVKDSKSAQYLISPSWKDVTDPNTGVLRYRRYSCAGFVLDSYRRVDIELLQIDASSLPAVDRRRIVSAYPWVRPSTLPKYGLQGNGPWRIVLAGYVLHALNRSTEEIRRQPYQVQPGDECF